MNFYIKFFDKLKKVQSLILKYQMIRKKTIFFTFVFIIHVVIGNISQYRKTARDKPYGAKHMNVINNL